MIDFDKLEILWRSKRKDSKPLSNVATLTKHNWRGAAYMRNTTLHKINDTHWRVDLHGNPIAHITRLDDGNAHVRLSNVDGFPTVTTAARLSSVLGITVWRHDHKLRAAISNLKDAGYRTTPPLRDGQILHVDATGVRCINPEVVTEQRERVNKSRSREYIPYIQRVRKLATSMARLGALEHPTKPAGLDVRQRFSTVASFMPEPDHDICENIVFVGYSITPWRYKYYTNDGELKLRKYIDAGVKLLGQTIYKNNGVYETYTHSFADQFTQPMEASNDAVGTLLKAA